MTCKLCGTEIKENETACSLCGTAVENTSTTEETSAPVVETPTPAVEEIKTESVSAAPAAESKFVCSGCGKEYPAGTKFCSECGGKVEEVKPAAPVVFACTGCGKEYPAGTKFCSECGGKVEEVKPVAPVVFACTGCGKEYPAGTKFCSECGGKVTAKGESEKEKSETVSFEGSTLYNIYLLDCGNNNIAVIKEIRRVTGCALSDAYTLADSTPFCLKEGCSAKEVEAIKKQFDACGAVVKIEGSEQKESNKPRPQAVVTVYHECPECFENYEKNPGKCPACGNQVESRYDLELTNFNWTLEDCKYLLENGIDCNLLWQKIVTLGADDEYFEEEEFDEEENNRIAEYLLSKGADINFSNPGQMNALSHAVEFNWFDRVKFLVERGADVNRKGDPALSYCNKPLNNNELGEKIKSYLITHGAVVEKTPVEWIEEYFGDKIAKLKKEGGPFAAEGYFATETQFKYGLSKTVFEKYNINPNNKDFDRAIMILHGPDDNGLITLDGIWWCRRNSLTGSHKYYGYKWNEINSISYKNNLIGLYFYINDAQPFRPTHVEELIGLENFIKFLSAISGCQVFRK